MFCVNISDGPVTTGEEGALTVYVKKIFRGIKSLDQRESSDEKNIPTCSLPLNTYNLQLSVGFRASGGSLYFRTVDVPSACFTIFVAAARRPNEVDRGQ